MVAKANFDLMPSDWLKTVGCQGDFLIVTPRAIEEKARRN